MADTPRYPQVDPDSDDETGPGPGRESPPGTPRWVKGLGIAALVAVLIVVIVMVIAGGEHGPGRHAPPGDADTQAPAASGPVSASGPISVGGPADAQQATRTVEVTTLDTMAFEPGAINVSSGETVNFEVTNAGQAMHEFTLGNAAMQQEHADAMAHMPAGMAHDLPNSIVLQPGATKQLTWRFGATGTLEYACHEPGHYDAGMRGQIKVG